MKNCIIKFDEHRKRFILNKHETFFSKIILVRNSILISQFPCHKIWMINSESLPIKYKWKLVFKIEINYWKRIYKKRQFSLKWIIVMTIAKNSLLAGGYLSFKTCKIYLFKWT